MDELLIDERDIPQSERDKIPAGDFAGPDRSFPIATQADVDAAAHLIGKADDPEAVKAKIIAIAKRKGLTVPDAWVQKESAQPLELFGDCIALSEAGLGPDGTFPVKIIQEGWGASGYYGKAVLSRDAPKAFPRGTHMYVNHATAAEQQARRGARDVRDLAAVLVEQPAWSETGFDGPGVYSHAKPFSAHAAFLKEAAPYIGVSIHAGGFGEAGEAAGRKGTIVKRIDEDKDGLHSVDFVPRAGAGGTYLSMYESAVQGAHTSPPPKEEAHDMPEMTLQEAQARITAVEAEITAKDAKITELTEALAAADARIAELTQAGCQAAAAKIVDEALAASKLPPLIVKRLAESLKASVPLKDGTLDEAVLSEAAKQAIEKAVAEVAEFAKLRVTGMGTDGSSVDGAAGKQLRESFKRRYLDQGLTEAEAEKRAAIAAAGR